MLHSVVCAVMSPLFLRGFAQTLSILVLVSAAPGTLAKDAADGTVEMVKRMESTYARIHDLSADFVQVSQSKALGRREEERGRLYLERPGRMRFEYQVPEEKLFIAQGEDTWFYLPADNQVIEAPRNDLREAGVTALLLDGAPTFLEDYEVEKADDEKPAADEMALRFTPKAKRSYRFAVVTVGVMDGYARRVTVEDNDGNRTEYSFERLRVNEGLPPGLFDFTPPKGAEIRK